MPASGGGRFWVGGFWEGLGWADDVGGQIEGGGVNTWAQKARPWTSRGPAKV
jgi:hypothetical protein